MVLAPLALVVLAGVVSVVRRAARVERWRARRMLGVHLDEPAPPPERDGLLEWVTGNLKDTAAWRAVAYLAVRFALGNVAFLVDDPDPAHHTGLGRHSLSRVPPRRRVRDPGCRVAVRIADVDQRRIGQDLHDGAQVRLTALAMQLGLTREALAGRAA